MADVTAATGTAATGTAATGTAATGTAATGTAATGTAATGTAATGTAATGTAATGTAATGTAATGTAATGTAATGTAATSIPMNPKEACVIWWNENPNDHERFLTLPNFNAAIFKEITGIDVQQTSSEQEAIAFLKKNGYKIIKEN
jgi:hypothetical protein